MPSTTVSPCCARLTPRWRPSPRRCSNRGLSTSTRSMPRPWRGARRSFSRGCSPVPRQLRRVRAWHDTEGLAGWRAWAGSAYFLWKNLPTTKLLDAGFPVYGGNGQIGFFDSYLYKDRQVLVACRGGCIWESKSVSARSILTNNSLVLESTELLTFSYLKGFMTRADLTPYVTGSAQPQSDYRQPKNFKILVPPQPMVAHYEAFAGLIENRIEGKLPTSPIPRYPARHLATPA